MITFLTGSAANSFSCRRWPDEAAVGGRRVGGGEVALWDVAVIELAVGSDAPVVVQTVLSERRDLAPF